MEIWQARSNGVLSDGAWPRLAEFEPHLVLVFGSSLHFKNPGLGPILKKAFPGSSLLGCSTAGEIVREGALDGQLVLTALRFREPAIRCASVPLPSMEDSRTAGRSLGERLAAEHPAGALHGVLLLGPGVQINGSAVIEGLTEAVGPQVPVCGALAGDDGHFVRTFTLCEDRISDREIVAVGFYGNGIELRTSSAGGWIPFGPVRRITRARDNVLYELDGESALEVYRRYLGPWAKDLPASGLLFPISLLETEAHESGLIRTLLGIHEPSGSLILAGDVPEGTLAQLMHADTRSLVEGAETAARAAMDGGRPADLALLFSCVGRKLVMGGRVDEEVDAVVRSFEGAPIVAGFYSYGEIGPYRNRLECKLHNQTMTVTLVRETA